MSVSTTLNPRPTGHPFSWLGQFNLIQTGKRFVSNNDAVFDKYRFSPYQIIQAVISSLIVLILSGIYNNYSTSVELTSKAVSNTATQLTLITSQVSEIQKKVDGIPTIQSDLVMLKVQNAELQRRVGDLEHRVIK